MYISLQDPSRVWNLADLVPVTEFYSEEEYPEGRYLFGADGYTITTSDSGTFLSSGQILDRTLAELLNGDIPDIAPLHVTFATPGDYTVLGTQYGDGFEEHDGNDTLWGLGGDDRFFTGAGNDVIRGGQGADEMDGGEGTDIFILNAADFEVPEIDRPFVVENQDTIYRFTSQDIILSDVAFYDSNGDGIISSGRNRQFDFTDGRSLKILSGDDVTVKKIEFDGTAVFDGVEYFVYSRVGSSGTLAALADFPDV